MLLTTIEPPQALPLHGGGTLVEARVCRPLHSRKSKNNPEADAVVVSEQIPFLEYDLHRQLLLKLKVLGMNAAFGLRSTVQLGRNVLMGVTTATAVHLPALPPPGALRINRSIAVKVRRTVSERSSRTLDAAACHKLRPGYAHCRSQCSADR